MPTDPGGRAGEPSAALETPAERVGLDEVGEGPLAVDLDDRDRRAVGRLELGIPADVDAVEVPCAHAFDDGERGVAQVTPLRVIDRDSRDTGLA